MTTRAGLRTARLTIALTAAERSLIAARAASSLRSEPAFVRQRIFGGAAPGSYPEAPALAAVLATLTRIETTAGRDPALIAELRAAVASLRQLLLARLL